MNARGVKVPQVPTASDGVLKPTRVRPVGNKVKTLRALSEAL